MAKALKEALRRFFFILAFWQHPKKRARVQRTDPSRGKEIEEEGRWYYLRDVLDRLDDYLISIRHLRSCDPNMYDLYSQIGGCVSSPKGLYLGDELSPTWTSELTKRPAFGMCHFTQAKEDTKDRTSPRCIYFRKQAFAAGVQAERGTLYQLVCFYDGRQIAHDLKAAVPMWVNVSRDGKVKLLKERIRIVLPHKNRHKPGVPMNVWRYPEGLEDRCDADIEKHGGHKHPAGYVPQLFIFIANLCESATCDIQVRAEKDGLPAVFSVDLLRTPYFFQERDKVKVNGRTKKIFHIVRTHQRRFKNGKSTFVRSHFRGVRRFMWHGYKVTITMPGFHHLPIGSFGAASVEFDDTLPVKGWMDTRETGRALAEHMDR